MWLGRRREAQETSWHLPDASAHQAIRFLPGSLLTCSRILFGAGVTFSLVLRQEGSTENEAFPF